MKKEITGGMSEQEVRVMLRKRGVLAFQALAGMIPQKTDLIDNLPTFRVVFNQMDTYRIYRDMTSRRYHMARLSLKCEEPMCKYCADYLDLFVQPKRAMWQVNFMPHWQNETCCICGGICEDDDIPF